MAEINQGKIQEIQAYLSGIGDFVRNIVHRCGYDWEFSEKLNLFELASFFASSFTTETNKDYNCGKLITQYIQNAPVRSSKFQELFGINNTEWQNYLSQNVEPILDNADILTNEDVLADFLFAIFQWGQQSAATTNEAELLEGEY